MLTKEQVVEYFKSTEGQSVYNELIKDYIENNEEGKQLVDQIIKPEIERAKLDAIKEWENSGKGKALKEKNQELLSEVAKNKENVKKLEKFQNLLDMSGFLDYNELETQVLSIKKGDGDSEVAELKKELMSYRTKARELEAKLPEVEQQLESTKNAFQESESYISNLLIKDQITKALTSQGFDELQAKGLFPRINELGKFRVEPDEVTGERKAFNEYGLTPEQYVLKEYLPSDEGKAYKPNLASGGNALGNSQKGNGRRKSLSDLSWSERQRLQIENPSEYQKLKNAANA